jgi:type IV secretory pathway TraG/TraD family ATPase VirD4
VITTCSLDIKVFPEIIDIMRGNVMTVPSVPALMIAASGCVRLFGRATAETHKRGAIVKRVSWIHRACARLAPRDSDALALAGVPLSRADETRHFKLIGATGAGKSTVIRDLMAQALGRGDRALFADPDGGYCMEFFDRYRGDVLLNPFERGSVKWDPFAELRDPYDVEQLAGALIAPSADPASGEWRGYARTFLAALLRRGCVSAEHDSKELWHRLAVAPVEELRAVVAGTPAQPFLDAENARMFASIRSVAVAALAAFEHVLAQRTTSFSVRDWVSAPRARGCLFVTYKAQQIAALRSLVATWVRLAIFEALNGLEGHDQRLWFVVDELDALGVIDGLKDALARLRKFGGRCVLGFQSVAQVSSTYGAGDAHTLVENCGNTLILRCSSSEQGGTSQFASRLIGEREVVRKQVARHLDHPGLFDSSRGRRSRNTTQQHITEMAVLASQIERLPDLEGYFKRATAGHWLRVSVSPPRRARGG